MTVRFIILFLEGPFVKLFQTECTLEVFWMKLLLHSCDASASDGFVAPSTEGAPHCMVVNLTVWDATMVKETGAIEGCSTFLRMKTYIVK